MSDNSTKMVLSDVTSFHWVGGWVAGLFHSIEKPYYCTSCVGYKFIAVSLLDGYIQFVQ